MLKRQPRDDHEPDANPLSAIVTEPPPISTQVAPAAPVGSVVDAQARLDGSYEAGQDLRLEGSVAGRVVCRGLVLVAADAFVTATVIAREAVIEGRFDGDLRCSERVLLAASAVVTGSVQARLLVVQEGAKVDGNVSTAAATLDSLIAAAAPAPQRKRA